MFCKSCIQIKLEEEKAQDVERLHHSLHTMRAKVDEATALLYNEREIAQNIIKDARQLMTPVRDSVQDAEKIQSLNSELENLKVLISLMSFCFSIMNNRMSIDLKVYETYHHGNLLECKCNWQTYFTLLHMHTRC